MKKNLLLIAVSVLCVACVTEKKEIEEVAYNYLDAMGNYRIDDARPYASAETCEKTLDVFINYLMPKVDTNYIKSNTPATIEILSVDILSDTTAVVSYEKTTPITVQKDGRLDMIKEDGRWCAEVIIALPPIVEMDSTELQSKISSRLDSLKNRKFTIVEKKKK
ncbi:MAG: DUF4878 domain-containing protein [Bacteroidales bacterium]|nr:DUF4878 domain-containing protein [Bacteroidales bacterium]